MFVCKDFGQWMIYYYCYYSYNHYHHYHYCHLVLLPSSINWF